MLLVPVGSTAVQLYSVLLILLVVTIIVYTVRTGTKIGASGAIGFGYGVAY